MGDEAWRDSEGGLVEFLATGQQFVALGTHPSGVRYEWLLAAIGPEALEVGYEGAQIVEWMSRRCIPGTIYAGTSEIQRSIVAESALKLPRTRG